MGRLFVFLFATLSISTYTFQDSYVRSLLIILFINIILILSYEIVGGLMGYINLGHGAFFGSGAYCTAILVNHGFDLIPGIILASLATGFTSLFLGLVAVRLNGPYFSLCAFGVLGLCGVCANNLTHLTGGNAGLSILVSHQDALYYFAVLVACASLLTHVYIPNTKFGMGLLSIREDEETAQVSGVPINRAKMKSMLLSGWFASLAGGIYIGHSAYISPSSAFGLEQSLGPIVMAMLGGSGTTIGPLLGIVFLTIIQEGIWTQLPYFQLSLYGAVMIITIILLPRGIAGMGFFSRFNGKIGSK